MNKEHSLLLGRLEIKWHGSFDWNFLESIGLFRFYRTIPTKKDWWSIRALWLELEYFVPTPFSSLDSHITKQYNQVIRNGVNVNKKLSKELLHYGALLEYLAENRKGQGLAGVLATKDIEQVLDFTAELITCHSEDRKSEIESILYEILS